MKRVLLVGSQHGNELLGEVLYAHIKQFRKELLPYLTYITGNIRARKVNVRFIESDLNRSYNGQRRTYEERRAARITRFIKNGRFDLILDLHTTTNTHIQPCLIIPSINETILPYLRASSIKKFVLMRHSMVVSSLIGTCPRAISVEVGHRSLNYDLMSLLCDDIERYLANRPVPSQRTVYEVEGLLSKGELEADEIAALRNFQASKHGFTPVLVGDKAYAKHTKYLGFKAYKVYETKV